MATSIIGDSDGGRGGRSGMAVRSSPRIREEGTNASFSLRKANFAPSSPSFAEPTAVRWRR